MSQKFSLPWYEFLVFGAVLLLSLGIGIFHGCFAHRKSSNEEFLMASRSMSILPVTLSLICSFVSAITLLGNPVEIYFYGSQYTLIAVAFIPMTLALAYLYVPTFFKLRLTSAYQYFEWRFSVRVRVACSIFAIVHLMFYMPITVFGPSLALDQVAGIDYKISAAAIFLVCIAYSSIGGLRAVLWTDALQAFVMVGAMLAVIFLGIYEVGGISYIWSKAAQSDRTQFFIMDPDPRARHTFWTATLGGFLMWLPLFAATQAQIQRYNSVPSLRQSRQCLVFNMVGMMLVIVLCSIIGLTIYAQYYTCDPVESEKVTSADQLLPFFVMDVLGGYSGLPGLVIAGLTCGSLSTVSSALNSLTAIIVEDFVKRLYPKKFSDVQLGGISKLISMTVGLIAFALVFVVASVNDSINISPFSTLMHGSLLGPILGAFSLGMFFPWTNDLGTQLGIFFSILTSGFIGLGNIIISTMDKLPDQKLPLSTSGCSNFSVDSNMNKISLGWKEEKSSFWIKLWSISYIWQPAVGIVTTIVFGLCFSAAVNYKWSEKICKVKRELLAEPFLKLWIKFFGHDRMSQWVDFDQCNMSKEKWNEK